MGSHAGSSVSSVEPGGDPVGGWLSGVRRGDPAALEALYRAWYDRMVAMAAPLNRRDHGFALDCVQDAMVKLINKPPQIVSEDQLAGWLRRAILSSAIDRLRREQRATARQRRASMKTGDSIQDPHREAAAAEELAWLERSLDELSASERSILRLRVTADQTLGVAAEQEGVSPGAAHGKTRRLLERLRERAREIFR